MAKDDENLGLGVTFTASVEGFAKQLDDVKARLQEFAKQLDSLGATAEKSGKTLADANVKAEQAITKVTEATKEAVTATGEATKVAETLATSTKKTADASKDYSRSLKETREALKGLDAATISQVHSSGMSNEMFGALSKKLETFSGTSIQARKALAEMALSSDNNVMRFKQLSSALEANEKVIMQADASYKKLKSTLGASILPTYTKDWANGLDRVKMAQSSLNGELFRSDSGIALTKGNFASLQRELVGLRKSYGDAAWSAIEADKRLGAGISTVSQLKNELAAYQKVQVASSKYSLEAGKAIEATALSMNNLGLAGNKWAEGVDKSAVATGFMKNQIVNANGSLLEMGKTVYETGDRITKMRDKFKDLSENTFNKIQSQLGTNINTWQEFGTALQKSSDRAKAAQADNAALGRTHRELSEVAGASTKAIDFYQQAVQRGSITGQQAVNSLKSYVGRMADIKAAAGSVLDQHTRLNASYQELNNSTGRFKIQYDELLKSLDGSKTAFFTTNENIKRLNASFMENEKGAKAWNEAIKNVGSASPLTTDKIKSLESAINSGTMTHKEAIKALNAHAASLGKFAMAADRPRGFLAGLTQSILGGASAATKAEGYFARLGTAVGSLAAWIPAAMIISTLTEAITEAISSVKDYDQALKSLQAISGGTEAEIGLLGKEMLHVSDTTKYSASEIAKGAIYIAQAGFTAGESLQVIAAAARGAQGTMEPLTTAADLLTTVIRAFHIDATQASVVMDKLAMAANKSKTDLEGMKVVFNYLGPAAYSAGVGLNETLGTLMALSNVGMRMSTVGTSLRQVFIGLENPSAKLKAALAALGMTTDDLSVKKMGSLEKVLVNLDKVIGGSLTNAVQFFNVRAGNAALVISQMNAHVAMMIQYTKEYGASAAMAGTQTEGMSVKMSMLGNQFQNFIIRMAEGGLTTAFKLVLDGASSLIKAIEYLISNPVSNFLITMGVMITTTMVLYNAFIKLASAIATVLLVQFTESSLAMVKMMTYAEVLTNGLAVLRSAFTMTTITKAISDMYQYIIAITKGVAILDSLKLAWAGVLSIFSNFNPISMAIIGLGILSAAIYTLVTSSERQSKALQENTITYANNAVAATDFAKKLRELNETEGQSAIASDSHVALLRQIRDTFPEVTAEIVKNKDSLEGQAAALDKVSASYAKQNEVVAKAAMGDLTRQYKEAGIEVGVYSRILSENRGLLEQTAIAITAVVPGILSYIGSLAKIPGAAEEAHRAWTLLESAWNSNTSAQLINDAAIKQQEALNKQRELYPQVASIIINSTKEIRQALIDMIPEGEMKRAALGTVEMHDKMVASLKVGASEIKTKEIDAVAEMGAKWFAYYSQQDEMGKAEVARFAGNAERKIATAMKAFEKENKGSKDYATLRINEEIRLNEEFYQKMLDLRSKNVENLLKLEDKLYEEQHKRRKQALEVTLQQLDLQQKQEIALLGNKGLTEDKYLKEKETIEQAYFAKNVAAIEANTKAELASLETVHQAKRKTLDLDKTLTKEARDARMAVIESENTDKLVAIYREQLAAYKTHISEKAAENARYKTEYDRNLKELQRLEEEHLKTLLAANKKYQKEVADANLANTKLTEDIDRAKRESLRSTMTDSEVARDKVNEFNDTIAKGYASLAQSEKESDSITKKEKIKAAQDYFKEAQGMIRGLVKENIDADGKVTLDKERTQRAQLGYYDEIKAAADKATAEMKKAAALEREETIAADKAKTEARETQLKKEQEVIQKNMKATSDQLQEMMDKFNAITTKVNEAIVIKADTTKTYEELKKLVDHVLKLNTDKSLEVVLSFMGKASDAKFLGEKVTEITGWLTNLSQVISGKAREFIVNFKGNDNGWYWLGSLIDTLIVKMNNLYAAANRAATFTVTYVTKGVPPTGSSETSTESTSSGEAGSADYSSDTSSWSTTYGEHAEGGLIPGTGDGDTVPGMLTPGEFVIQKPVVRGLGEGFFHFINGLKSFSVPKFNMGAIPAYAGGGMVRSHEVFTLNLQAGSATLPLKVVGKPASIRQSIRQFEKELSKVRLSRG